MSELKIVDWCSSSTNNSGFSLTANHKIAVDSLSDTFFVAENGKLFVLSPSVGAEASNTATDREIRPANHDSREIELIPVNDETRELSVIMCDYLPDQCLAFVGLSNGNFFLYDPLSDTIEKMVTLEGELMGGSWSPDWGMLAVHMQAADSSEDLIYLLDRDLETVHSIPADPGPDALGKDQLVSIGWGKKETQFQGSAGKQAAFTDPEEWSDLHRWDDGKTIITWKGNADYFAVNSVSKTTKKRMVRVWNEGLELSSSFEPTTGIEAAVAWLPVGNRIAAVASNRDSTPKKVVTSAGDSELATETAWKSSQAVIFEQNGLRHGGFPLQFPSKSITSGEPSHEHKTLNPAKEMSWSRCGSVLALWTISGSTSYVSFYTCSNYTWSLKQQFEFENVLGLMWDQEANLKFHIILSDTLVTVNFMLTSYQFYTEKAPWLSVNGDCVGVSEWGARVIPPPLSMRVCRTGREGGTVTTLTFDSASNRLTCWSQMEPNRFSLCDMNQQGTDSATVHDIYPPGSTDGESLGGRMITAMSMVRRQSPSAEETASASSVILLIATVNSLSEQHDGPAQKYASSLLRVRLSPSASSETDNSACGQAVIECEADLEGSRGLSLLNHPSQPDQFLMQDQTGAWRIISLPMESLKVEIAPESFLKMPRYIPQSWVLVNENEKLHVVSLTSRYQLLVDGTELSQSVSSVYVVDGFLLFVTFQQKLYCMPTDHICLQPHWTKEALSHWGRTVERGSRIVGCVQGDTRVVLQMPRGNIESIHPRTLTLAKAVLLIQQRSYETALVFMRKHRINLNLMYDHDPQAFETNVDNLVVSLRDHSLLTLFIMELSDENMIDTMYSQDYRRALFWKPLESLLKQKEEKTETKDQDEKTGRPQPKEKEGKVNCVCALLRAAILKQIRKHRKRYTVALLNPLLSTYLKTRPVETDEALKQLHSIAGKKSSGKFVASGVDYLSNLVSAAQLYSSAVGTYNFDIIMAVAQKFAMDPKEYLPFLNDLKEMEVNYRQFKMECSLKHWSKALLHISRCPEDRSEEIVQFVTDKELFADALTVFPADTDLHSMLCHAFADHLSTKGQWNEAGGFYLRSCKNDAEALRKAYDMYTRALNWKKVVHVSGKIGQSSEDLLDQLKVMSTRMKDKGMHSELSDMALNHLKDSGLAIECLCSLERWSDALMLAADSSSVSCLEDVKSKLVSRAEYCLETVNDKKLQFCQWRDRLLVVRKEKKTKWDEWVDGGEDGMGPGGDIDAFSEASHSTASSLRSTSSMSSVRRWEGRRNRKERKKRNLKEGSRYEDVALLTSLTSLYDQVDKLQDDSFGVAKKPFGKSLQDVRVINFRKNPDFIPGFQLVLDLCPVQRFSASLPGAESLHAAASDDSIIIAKRVLGKACRTFECAN